MTLTIMSAASAWVQTYEHVVPVQSNQSVTLWYQGNADSAILNIGGYDVDRVTLGNQPAGQLAQLNFFNGQPLHRGLGGYSACDVKFISRDPTPPVVTAVATANNLTWADIGSGLYNQNVTLADTAHPRPNNIMLYVQEGTSGMCALRYSR